MRPILKSKYSKVILSIFGSFVAICLFLIYVGLDLIFTSQDIKVFGYVILIFCIACLTVIAEIFKIIHITDTQLIVYRYFFFKKEENLLEDVVINDFKYQNSKGLILVIKNNYPITIGYTEYKNSDDLINSLKAKCKIDPEIKYVWPLSFIIIILLGILSLVVASIVSFFLD